MPAGVDSLPVFSIRFPSIIKFVENNIEYIEILDIWGTGARDDFLRSSNPIAPTISQARRREIGRWISPYGYSKSRQRYIGLQLTDSSVRLGQAKCLTGLHPFPFRGATWCRLCGGRSACCRSRSKAGLKSRIRCRASRGTRKATALPLYASRSRR